MYSFVIFFTNLSKKIKFDSKWLQLLLRRSPPGIYLHMHNIFSIPCKKCMPTTLFIGRLKVQYSNAVLYSGGVVGINCVQKCFLSPYDYFSLSKCRFAFLNPFLAM